MANMKRASTSLTGIGDNMTTITPGEDEWPYIPYELNEYGLVNNTGTMLNNRSILNLARFFFFNANDGLVDDIEEAAAEIVNIMRGEFYISNTDGEE